MDSCFALIGAHQQGIAVGRTGKISAYQRLFTADTRVKGEGSLIQGDFLACAWHVSFLRREKEKGKKDGWITRKVLRVLPPIGPLRWVISCGCLICEILIDILLHGKFLQLDWLRAVVFQLNLKYLHVKLTKPLRVVV